MELFPAVLGILVLLGFLTGYVRNTTQIYVELPLSQLLELAQSEPGTPIFSGKTATTRISAYSIYLKGVWYVSFEPISSADIMTFPESRLLRVKKIHGL